MFDDQPIQGAGAVPNNLPLAEPEDMFSRIAEEPVNEPEMPATAVPGVALPTPEPLSSALAMGVLKPKAPSEEVPPASPPPAPSPYPTKGPVLSRIFMAILLIVIIGGVLGAGAWYVYAKFFQSAAVTPSNTVVVPPPSPSPVAPPVAPPVAQPTPPADAPDTIDSKLLFGEPIDSDGDSLDDPREKELGTDPQNWDTDHDGLSDSDEVTIWKTDPQNPDTDGDTYKDGDEVKNGYNPAGSGKIFEPPKP